MNCYTLVIRVAVPHLPVQTGLPPAVTELTQVFSTILTTSAAADVIKRGSHIAPAGVSPGEERQGRGYRRRVLWRGVHQDETGTGIGQLAAPGLVDQHKV